MSLYYIANEIATTSTGMMIAIPEPEWAVFETMSTAELAAILRELAQREEVGSGLGLEQRMRRGRREPLDNSLRCDYI